MGWPAVREMVKQIVKVMGNLYVMGENITKAINNKKVGFSYSFDMLGEAATNWDDANAYYEKYIEAAKQFKDSISVKLSAIHPRYELKNWEDVLHTMANQNWLLLQEFVKNTTQQCSLMQKKHTD